MTDIEFKRPAVCMSGVAENRKTARFDLKRRCRMENHEVLFSIGFRFLQDCSNPEWNNILGGAKAQCPISSYLPSDTFVVYIIHQDAGLCLICATTSLAPPPRPSCSNVGELITARALTFTLTRRP